MDEKWICESCFEKNVQKDEVNGFAKQAFDSQESLIEHIMHHHLLKKIQNGHTVFTCMYGPAGVCNKASILSNLQKCVTFDSQYEYERHLITKHIISNRNSTVSLHSKKLSLPTPVSHAWTQYDSVINMAAVLNDPMDRQLDIFSRYWGESFERPVMPPVRLPLITEDLFFPYLSILSKRKASATEGFPKIPSTTAPPSRALDAETVSVFCTPDFALSSPATFDRVIPLNNHHHGRRRRGSTSAFSQQSDRLAQHLDAVELAIVNHVSERSSAFFEAVRTHDAIKEQLSQIIAQVNAVRSRLQEVDAVYCKGASQIARLVRRKTNYKTLLAKLEMIASVHAAQPTIQSLLKSSDFCSALDLIATTRESLQTIHREPQGEVTCLRYLDDELTEIASSINDYVGKEFEGALHAVLTSNEQPDANAISEILQPTVLGLIRMSHSGLTEVINKEVQQVTQAVLDHARERLEATENGASQDASKTQNQAETESFSQWLTRLKPVFDDVELTLVRIRLVVECLASVAAASEEGGGGGERWSSLSAVAWRAAAERAQSRLATLVSARLRTHAAASSHDFVAFARILEDFHVRAIEPAWAVYRAELPLPRQSMALLNLVASRATVLVHTFHEERCRRLEAALVRDSWSPAPASATTPNRQRGLPPPLAAILARLLSHHELLKSVESVPEAAEASGVSDGAARPQVEVLGETFVVVDAVLVAISLLLDYLRLGEELAPWPPFLRDVQANLAKFFRLFNSRSCGLVLGAGACESGVLKKILARNIAALVRSLECFLALLPVVQIFFERLHFHALQGKTAKQSVEMAWSVNPFPPVENVIRQHVGEAVGALRRLLAARVVGCLRGWQPRPPTPSPELRAVCRAFDKLARSTADVLSPPTFQNLLMGVHEEFKTSLRNRLAELRVYPDGGPQQGLINSELVFYSTSLRRMTPALGQFADDFEDIWPSRTK